ncbi:VCBS repeat-containing protein [uncultured Croceitalea sp.]|uniref:VCBS repeat-containing protein n=1 Tax=uncultured Croceitalea sp. TaxID=1798908 RepID=UPI003305A921
MKRQISFRLTCYTVFVLFFVNCSQNATTTNDTGYLFEQVSTTISGIDFSNDLLEDAGHNIINYIYFYNGAGVSVGDINNDGLPDVFFVSNQGNNKLYLNKGELKFEDISVTAGIHGNADWNTGSTMVDINADGYLDIYVCAVSGLLDFKGHNELYINNGDGTFTEKSSEYGLDFKGYSTQSYFFDYDKDDDLDVYIVNHAVHTTLSHGPAKARSKRVPLVGDVLLKNKNGRFSDVSEEANIYGGVNGYGLSASIEDFNGDGWEDIYVCNDFHEDDYYYINNQNGTFTESLDKSFSTISRFSMGSDAADMNNDGFVDLITLDMLPSDERVIKESEGDDALLNLQNRLKRLGYSDQYSRNMLQINHQGDYFVEEAILNGISATDWSWGPLITDFDNDGHQDVFISNGILRRPNDLDFKQYISSGFKNRNPSGSVDWLYKSIDEMPSGKVSNEIFKGNSDRFENRTGEWMADVPSLSNGAAYTDLDNDGDLDLVINNLNEPASILENKSNSKNYLSVKIDYKGQNPEGVGSKVVVYAGGKSQVKRLMKSRGFQSSIDANLHFGLDTVQKVDSVRVIWPDLTFQTITNPVVNQRIIIKYKPAGDKNDVVITMPKNNFKKVTEINYMHTEDAYYDYYNERLIPFRVSTMGPGYDVADVDGNGFDDLFIGNAAGSKASLYLNNGYALSKSSIPAIENDSLYEDNEVHFFDIDGDNDQDLYIASGLTAKKLGKNQEDRLYINENGIYKRADKNIPFNDLIATCAVSNDYDGDGDMDLFVGNLAKPGNYGVPVKSFILNNDGKGHFSIDTSFELVSMVNSAVWSDVNNDGYDDLLVATDWDAPKVYLNFKGKLKEAEIPMETSGLWQTISTFDMDLDGDLDIVLGNWGLNTKFSLNDGPLKMYHNDFDKDGEEEAIVAYTIDGEFYPLNSRDELNSQMRAMAKRIVNYKDFALKTIEEVIGSDVLKESLEFEVQQLASGYLENNDGKFDRFIPLADDFQLAPINSLTKIQMDNVDYLLVSGNSFKVNTYHGGYTSLKGLLLKSKDEYKPVSDLGIEPFFDQVKGTASISLKDHNLLVVFINNGAAKTYSYGNKSKGSK